MRRRKRICTVYFPSYDLDHDFASHGAPAKWIGEHAGLYWCSAFQIRYEQGSAEPAPYDDYTTVNQPVVRMVLHVLPENS